VLPRKVSFRLFQPRRSFLKSLSRSAFVLSLENLLGGIRPLLGKFCQSPVSLLAANQASSTLPLGVNFLNVAKESGLNAKTIFGGEQINFCWRLPAVESRSMITTTTAGWIFFWSMAGGWKVFQRARSRTRIFSRIIATAHLPMSRLPLDLSTPGGDKAFVSVTTTMTDTRISSSAISAKMFCTTTTATARLPM